MEQIRTKADFDREISGPGLTVAVFRADWCGDCHFIDPFMPEVEEQRKDQLKLIQIDVEEVEEVSQSLNILGIPSFVAFSNGQELVRFVNKARKSRAEIESFLDRAAEVHGQLAHNG
ncbi:thioredoxin family protein [Saccharibacillus sp. CPCC 101409]|uniref:thioredoxin family protein n=1 Tax=Saccharibacillus sp. CPCC 101409 TaxID=3058041 RepID=UPI002671EF0D|nr:thioredoxin family protein [Saccharibacillus sp. CPCC 101409]MDO3411015.1 thioredoxin family protein [Saccharibacillus sp. CPCC 101409]